MTAASDGKSLSIIIPAKNEAASIAGVVSAARALYRDAEILVVDDGSDDDTASLAGQSGAKVVRGVRFLPNLWVFFFSHLPVRVEESL